MISEQVVTAAATSTEAACKNCGTSLSGHFCADCGQPDKHLDPSLHDLLHELVHEFLHLDGKIVTTLKALVFSPGRLSAEYLAGRRARYIGPIRLYLTLSVLFFLLAAYSPEHVRVDDENRALKDTKALEINAEIRRGDLTNSRFDKVISKSIANPESFKHAFLSNISRVMFAIVPLFALGLFIAYKNRGRRYPAFVYFSLHYHAFVFLALTFHRLVAFIGVSLVDSVAGYVLAAGLPTYLFLALRKVFGGTKMRTAFRMAALAGLYLPCLVIGVAVAGVVTLFSM